MTTPAPDPDPHRRLIEWLTARIACRRCRHAAEAGSYHYGTVTLCTAAGHPQSQDDPGFILDEPTPRHTP